MKKHPIKERHKRPERVAYQKQYMSTYQLSEESKKKNREWYKKYKLTPKYRFVQAKNAAKQRGISFFFTFEEWLKVWQDSGHWEERGPKGYCMCRKGDEGPYSIDNVYIALHIENKKDAWGNGKISRPPLGVRLGMYAPLSDDPLINRSREYQRKYQKKKREERENG